MATLTKGKRLSAIRKEERAKRLAARERFRTSKRAAAAYEKQLKQVAKHIGDLIEGMAPGGYVVGNNAERIKSSLNEYSKLLRPWAESVSSRMIAEADQRNKKAWLELSREMGQNLRHEFQTAPTGETYQSLMQEQVKLITSLPLDAAERVHNLTMQAMAEGRRASEIAAEVAKSGEVSKSRAMLIARTETSRTAVNLTEARAKYVGSEGYIWRTAGDADVRDRHKHLEGTYHRWDDPPVAGERGERAHAGCIYNCRCFPEPILPDVIE